MSLDSVSGNIFTNELAPWERKYIEYRDKNLGVDLLSFSKSSLAIQLQNLNATIANHGETIHIIDQINRNHTEEFSKLGIQLDEINTQLGHTNQHLDNIDKGVSRLGILLEEGFYNIAWKLEQNSQLLKGILEVLSTPLDTRAKELKKRADKAFQNGWIEDAELDYLESEKLNRYDFSVHISLGLIYNFDKIDKHKAFAYAMNKLPPTLSESCHLR